MYIRIANRAYPDQTASRSSLIWVCTVCLDLSGRQIMSKILELSAVERVFAQA